jgi:multicomponent Na+:H+ antiporter subunit G
MAANVSEFLALIGDLLALIGTFFMLVAALGVLRLPDLFTRMHSSTKSATLGIGCVMLSAAFHFRDLGTVTQALAIIFFVFITAPVAAHLLGRAAYLSGVPLWEGTLSDELRGRYDEITHELTGYLSIPLPEERR